MRENGREPRVPAPRSLHAYADGLDLLHAYADGLRGSPVHSGNYYPSKLNGDVSSAYPAWLDRLEEASKKVVVIECGAGLVIPSARCEAEDVAERFGTALVRINPTDCMAPASEPHGVGLPLGRRVRAALGVINTSHALP